MRLVELRLTILLLSKLLLLEPGLWCTKLLARRLRPTPGLLLRLFFRLRLRLEGLRLGRCLRRPFLRFNGRGSRGVVGMAAIRHRPAGLFLLSVVGRC